MTSTPSRIYLAHPIGTYGTLAEARAIAHLQGWTVVNPAEPQYAQICGTNMEAWAALARGCDALAMLPYADGKIGAGAHLEALRVQRLGKPVFRFHGEALVPWDNVAQTPHLSIELTRKRNRRQLPEGEVRRVVPNTEQHPDLLAVARRHRPRLRR